VETVVVGVWHCQHFVVFLSHWCVL